MCLALFGRTEEALAEAQRSLKLEPFSSRLNFFRARILFFLGNNDRAIEQLLDTLEMEPNSPAAHELLGYAYEKKGIHKDAIAEWGKALTLTGMGEQAAILERVYAASGFEAAVSAVAQDQVQRLNQRVKQGEYVPAHEYVTAYTRLNEKNQAFAWLDRAMIERNGFVFEVQGNPIYDKLRADPRFSDLLRRNAL